MKSRLVIAAALLMVAACSEEPQEVVVPPVQEISGVKTYDAQTFFESTSYGLAGSYAWSHDDTALLLSSDVNGTLNVYSMDPSSGEMTALTDSTSNAHRAASWFPNDDRVIFLQDSGGNELFHVYVREVSGDIKDLTPGDNVRAMFSGWSKDDEHFFVLTNERDPQAMDLYKYSAKDYSRELVFENTGNWFVVAGSRDERYLVLLKAIHNADSDLYLVDRTTDSPEPVLLSTTPGDISHTAFTFTPDDSALIYGTNEYGEFQSAWRYDLETGEHTPYLESDWDVSGIAFSREGHFRTAVTNEDGVFVVRITDVESGAPLALNSLPDGNLANARFSRDEKRLAIAVTTDTSPRDIYTVDLKTGTSKRLTEALNPAIDEADLVVSETVRYPSFDGLQIPAVMYKPRGANADNKVPAIVFVHGGPGGQSRPGYSGMMQHLVNHGFAVFMANNRGSSGYGKTFFHMDDLKHGEVDLDDIVYAEKYLASLDWVDADRIAVMGGSYGGYMVGAALAFRPGVFKVGVNIFGVMNWVRTLESIPAWWGPQRDALFAELGDPATDRERLERISPLFHASNINVPLLVVQGANDPRVLQVESDEIVEAVRANEVPVEYLVFPDEGHGFSQRANRIAASEAYIRFLNQYLE